jgi:hypothetical protein
LDPAQFHPEFSMHDLLIALAFVSMVICPAVVATMHHEENPD